jgi:disaggregatase-related protein
MDRANIQKYGWGILSLLLVMLNSSLAEQTICVDADAPPGGDGTSWATAFKYLQDALAVVDANDEICVAHGTYVPDQNSVNPNGSGDRLATFQLISGIAIYGGYAGFGETDTNARDIELYETILSGDLEGNDESASGSGEIANEPTRAENSYHVVTGGDADSTAVLDGFTIIGGNASGSNKYGRGGGIFNHYCSNPQLINCIFNANTAGPYSVVGTGGAIFNDQSDPVLINCTLISNSAEQDGGGIYNSPSQHHENSPALTNCILWGNRDGDTDSQGQSEQIGGATPVIDNCCVEGWIGDLGGIGNFDADPYFAAPGLWIEGYWNDNDTPDDDEDDFWIDPSRVCGKYHLKSQAGRWESNSQSWITDDVTSPCIDTGNPITPIGHEPFPNGGIINLGAYGGTEEASKSYYGKPPCEIIIAGDINGDCIINLLDLSLMAHHWLEDNNP